MPNYKGRRPGTRRVKVWHQGRWHEWIVEGSKADGDRFEATKRLELEAHKHDVRVAPRLEPLLTAKYSPFARANLAESTWRARKNILKSLIEFFGEKKTTEITAPSTEAYKAHRISESKLSPSSVNTELRTLLIVLRWAEKQGYPVVYPAVRYLKEPKDRVRLWTEEQLDALLAAARTHVQVMQMTVYLLNTGCRKGEALALEWSWVDFKAGLIRIPANKYWKPKNGRAREVPLSDVVRAMLLEVKQQKRSDRWVFVNREGVGFDRFPDAIFKDVQTRAGVSGGAHTLRHCYASMFLQRVPDLFLLSKVLGHTHQRVTELYAHLLPNHLEAARNAVNFGAGRRRTGATTGAKKQRMVKSA